MNKRKFNKLTRPNRAQRTGFTLVEIMIVVLILGVLLNIALPSFIYARDKGRARSCVKNLNNFVLAKEQYVMDNKIPQTQAGSVTWSNISPYVNGPGVSSTTAPTCPTKGDPYNFGDIRTFPTCTYGGPAGQPQLAHSL